MRRTIHDDTMSPGRPQRVPAAALVLLGTLAGCVRAGGGEPVPETHAHAHAHHVVEAPAARPAEVPAFTFDGRAYDSDRAAVERAVLDYLEALYDVDPSKIARSVHRDLVKRGFYRDSPNGPYAEALMRYQQLYDLSAAWNAGGRIDLRGAPRQVTVLDVLDQTATAKLVAHWGVDYLQLAKYDGRWLIVQVLWQEHPRTQ